LAASLEGNTLIPVLADKTSDAPTNTPR
jgi:hypothetical protein